MHEALKSAGYTGAILNYTSQLIRPPDATTIATWERATRVVLPKYPPPLKHPTLDRH